MVEVSVLDHTFREESKTRIVDEDQKQTEAIRKYSNKFDEESNNVEDKNCKFKKETPLSTHKSPTASCASNSVASLLALGTKATDTFHEGDKKLPEINMNKQQKNESVTYQHWHEKPRSLSASSGEAFYHRNSHDQNFELHHHSAIDHLSYHFSQRKPNSANQSPCGCCYNLHHATENTYSISNSGSSSHDSISASQLIVSTSAAAISSIGSILSSTLNYSNNRSLQPSNCMQQANQSIITTIDQTSASGTIDQLKQRNLTSTFANAQAEERSRSAIGCLSNPLEGHHNKVRQKPCDSVSSSPVVHKQTVSLTKSDQETQNTALRHTKLQKQSRPSNNRLTNESSQQTIENNRSIRSRNLLLAHQLHKSLSTPTLIVHEEQTSNQTSERSSALSRIKNKFTGNSSNSNINTIKTGTSIFSTVRDKLLHENLALTCAPESDERGAKPKKRASLFFRKKKTKDTARKSAHQFVSVSYSISASCDVCTKTLANKAALHCENCLITVHDSACRDQILDCNRFSLAKKPNQLTLQVPDSSSGNLTNKAGNSSPTHSQQQNLISSSLNASISSLSATVNQTVSSANILSNLSGLNKQLIDTGSTGYATPLAVTPATSPSSSHAQLHPSSSISLNPIATNSFRKGHHPSESIGSFSSSDSSCSIQSKPNPSLSPSISRKSYTPSALSQWRRVRKKLGVNKVICEDKEAELNEDNASIIVEINSTSSESLEEPLTDLAYSSLVYEDDQPVKLRLTEEEPASWSLTVQSNLLKDMNEKEIKRQEAIYELILTEKHHCLTMKIMQRVFAEGMLREVQLPKDDVDRILPCLEPLLELHLAFLRRLRERQSKFDVVPNISDILLGWFSGKTAEKLRNLYGQFCSQHKEAIFLYKDYLKTDRKFQSFIKNCMSKPWCKTRGITECLLLVTQRISKYPLIIESLIKLDKTLCKQLSLQLNQDEQAANTEKLLKVEIAELDQCYVNVRQIIFSVDDQVAEKEREHRLLKIYNKIDPKSTAIVNGKKFRKSDLLSDRRKLQFETLCTYRNPHSKQTKNSIDCLLIILSDVIVFLQENNQKYHFAPIDNKSAVISLNNLIVREKAGQSSKGIFLISTNKNKEEMYELHFGSVKDQKQLIGQLNYTIALNQFEATNNEIVLTDNALMAWRLGITTPTCRLSNRRLELNQLINELHQKDRQLALILEEKIRLLSELLDMQGIVSINESTVNFADTLQLISYSDLLNDTCSQETLILAANEAYRIVQNLYLSGCNLSRSVSSAGEHQSEQFMNPPSLPKRAETFAGFDHNADFLARLLQKFAISENNITPTTSTTTTTTCSPSNMTTNTIVEKLAKCANDEANKELNLNNSKSVPSDEKIVTNELNESSKILNSIEVKSPAILVNTVLPMQDPSYLVNQLSTLPLLISQMENSRNSVDSELSMTIPQSKHEQVIQIVELQHQLNLLLCLFQHQQTLFELMRVNLQEKNTSNLSTNAVSSLNQSQLSQTPSTSASTQALNTFSTSSRTNLSTISPSNTQTPMHLSGAALPISGLSKNFRAANQLEELRNLHEKFSAEKQSVEKRTKELDRREKELKQEKNDLIEQRENLYRKLENIQDELGLCIGGESLPSSLSKLANSLYLISKHNNAEQLKSNSKHQQSVSRTRLSSGDIPFKQQLPLKLTTENQQTSVSKSCCASPNISPSITFDPINYLQLSQKKSSSISYCASSSITKLTSPSKPAIKTSGSRKEFSRICNQTDQPTDPMDSSSEDKKEEEIFC